MDIDLGLEGNVALVTGSATGLGHACAEALSRQGAKVALAAPNLDDLAYASDRLHALGEGEIFGLELDVRDPDHLGALVEETVDQYGGIDHLVTGPRPLEPERFLDVSNEDWFRGFDRLFMSVVWAIRESAAHLEASDQGTVVNVANPAIPALTEELSVATAYGRAVQGLVESQATAFAPDVRVNAVVPGPHETADLEELLARRVDAGEFADITSAWDAVLADCPYESPGQPLDLGKVVTFLSSQHASFVNGATVPVDGGSGL
ncbi:SDR family NAD(P)-dependent oxidoreductase [Halobellus inordinatus]|uniref:SDR family NAD(P)-dependent oxidoreductase n=1 Tax=Halobellus inordinatus TaxID=1126236 RepID=UPI002109C8BA|nr:SDR family oxidoreductase [Halobellus inordinatus]